MIAKFNTRGVLPAGVHPATWEELVAKFGFNGHRLNMLNGLKKGLNLLHGYGCREVYIDGSFTTSKNRPNDIDLCFDNSYMNWGKFLKEHPEFNNTKSGISIQKQKYQSEFYAVNAYEDYMLHRFQFSRDGTSKGIVKLYLTGRLL